SMGVVCAGLLLFSFLAINCINEPLAPVAPTWDTNITLPLANRFYSLSDIVRKDTSLLRVGAGNQIIYATSVQVSPTYVGDMMALTPRDTTLQVKLGPFHVSADPVRTPIDIPWMPRGETVPIPDTTVTFSDVEHTIPAFQEVELQSGSISLLLENNLPVPMDVTNPIRLFDSQNNIIATFVFNPPTIPPFESRIAFDDLSGKILDNRLRVSDLRFHTPGSATPVQIPEGELFIATLWTSDLLARRAVLAEIPAQNLIDNDTTLLRLDDSTIVRELRLKSGSLNLSLTNRVGLNMLFKFRFSELYRRVGGSYVPYEDSLFLAANGSGSHVIELANARIRSLNGDLLQSLQVFGSVILPNGSGQPVTVNDTDKVLMDVTPGVPLVADSAVGVIRPTWVDVNTTFAVDFGNLPTRFSGQFNIPTSSLGLQTLTDFGFPADLYIRLGARRNAAGDSVYITVPASERRVQPGVDHVSFDGSQVGQFLSQVSGRLPDSLCVVGRILVNPHDVYTPTPAGVGTVGRNSSWKGTVDVQIPMNLGIVDGMYADTLVIGDSTGDGHKDFDFDKSRMDDINYGKMYIEVENGMPIQLTINLRLLDRSRQGLLLLPQSGQGINVTAARVDAEGNVTAPSGKSTVIELNRQEVQQFNPAEFLSYSVALVTTPGSPAVRFKTTDYIRIRIWSSLSYRVK
ncbi:MAG: hypothetical protein HY708_03590, partial [Ignavibacteriae bacterium]|nr:hypothetical protein [Ignavibacteriota bacterium]